MGDMRTNTAILTDVILERTEVESLVMDFCAALMRSPTEALNRFCSSDISLRLLESPVCPGASGHFLGREAAAFAIRAILVNLQVISFEFDDIIIDGHEVGLRWRIRLQHRATGVAGDLAVFDHIVLRDGLIAGYTSFFDTDGFAKLLAGERQSRQACLSNRQPAALPQVKRPGGDADPRSVDLFARNRREHYLRDYWADRLKRGSLAIDACFTDDCEMHFVGDPSTISFARLHQGIEATRALIDATDTEFEILAFRIQHLLIDGDKAALHWTASVRHRGTSARGKMESFDAITFRNDRIFSVTKFFDTARTLQWIRG
jgi:ketosteroid isomerase-like protein